MHAAATVEVTAASYKKAAEYLAKSQALYIEAGDFHGRAKAMESLMDLYLEADMYVEAVRVAKERVTVFHDGGDMQGEGKALLRLGGILLDHGDFARAKTMAELAVNVFVGIGDYDSINGAKAIMDGAEKAKTIEDINTALVWANDYTHVPITLVVEPGLTKKIADDFAGLAH
mmetsp:Transcript_53931/g.167338  ORF Transcript_53931/g.167338 Transcript_53931/m.167338 type:complete len:173 (+) Transcript_53931:69-587(+)